MNNVQRRILATLLIACGIATLGILAQQYTHLEWLVTREVQLRAAVTAYPVRSWLTGLAIYTCLSMVPGTSGKSVVFGWLFGFWPAVILVDLALTTAAMITFLLSRTLFRHAIESRMSIHLQHLRQKMQGDTGFYLLLVRLLHAPFSFVNYGAGATNVVPLRTFWWTTQLGLLPGTMVFVFAGTRIPTLTVIAEQGVVALLDSTMLAALATTCLLPLMIRIVANQMAGAGQTAALPFNSNGRHTDCNTRNTPERRSTSG